MKIENERILLLLVIGFRDIEPVRHASALRAFINFGNKYVFSFLSDRESSQAKYQAQTERKFPHHQRLLKSV
jgi:hypothetical protein